MNAQELIGQASEAIHVRRVFGEPYQKNGLTIIPVAAVAGGWGGGAGQSMEKESGWGGGGGLAARPVGAFIIKGEQVSWQPTVDINRIVLMGQLLGICAILTLGATLRAWSRRR